MMITLNWIQVVAGLPTSVFYDTTTPLPHLPDDWTHLVRSHLHAANIKIHISTIYSVKTRRVNDQALMKIACENLPAKDVEKINRNGRRHIRNKREIPTTDRHKDNKTTKCAVHQPNLVAPSTEPRSCVLACLGQPSGNHLSGQQSKNKTRRLDKPGTPHVASNICNRNKNNYLYK